jgi:hypothetical protein
LANVADTDRNNSGDFLGNRISETSVTIAARSVRRIKCGIAGIIQRHLLFYLAKAYDHDSRIKDIEAFAKASVGASAFRIPAFGSHSKSLKYSLTSPKKLT